MRRRTDAEWEIEIDKRLDDLLNRKRFMVWSGDRAFPLYYIVGSDCWAMTNPKSATLFKRWKTAQAIRRCLRDGAKVTPVRVDAKGELVLGSLKYRRRKRRHSTTNATTPRETT